MFSTFLSVFFFVASESRSTAVEMNSQTTAVLLTAENFYTEEKKSNAAVRQMCDTFLEWHQLTNNVAVLDANAKSLRFLLDAVRPSDRVLLGLFDDISTNGSSPPTLWFSTSRRVLENIPYLREDLEYAKAEHDTRPKPPRELVDSVDSGTNAFAFRVTEPALFCMRPWMMEFLGILFDENEAWKHLRFKDGGYFHQACCRFLFDNLFHNAICRTTGDENCSLSGDEFFERWETVGLAATARERKQNNTHCFVQEYVAAYKCFSFLGCFTETDVDPDARGGVMSIFWKTFWMAWHNPCFCCENWVATISLLDCGSLLSDLLTGCYLQDLAIAPIPRNDPVFRLFGEAIRRVSYSDGDECCVWNYQLKIAPVSQKQKTPLSFGFVFPWYLLQYMFGLDVTPATLPLRALVFEEITPVFLRCFRDLLSPSIVQDRVVDGCISPHHASTIERFFAGLYSSDMKTRFSACLSPLQCQVYDIVWKKEDHVVVTLGAMATIVLPNVGELICENQFKLLKDSFAEFEKQVSKQQGSGKELFVRIRLHRTVKYCWLWRFAEFMDDEFFEKKGRIVSLSLSKQALLACLLCKAAVCLAKNYDGFDQFLRRYAVPSFPPTLVLQIEEKELEILAVLLWYLKKRFGANKRDLYDAIRQLGGIMPTGQLDVQGGGFFQHDMDIRRVKRKLAYLESVLGERNVRLYSSTNSSSYGRIRCKPISCDGGAAVNGNASASGTSASDTATTSESSSLPYLWDLRLFNPLVLKTVEEEARGDGNDEVHRNIYVVFNRRCAHSE